MKNVGSSVFVANECVVSYEEQKAVKSSALDLQFCSSAQPGSIFFIFISSLCCAALQLILHADPQFDRLSGPDPVK